MKANSILLFLLSVIWAGPCRAADSAIPPESSNYNSRQAAAYLDGRLAWWSTWPVAARDHHTFCVSCHTVLPYAMARPVLRRPLHESGPGVVEQALLANVTKRVSMWSEVEPFYSDATRGVPKTAESRGTESILNALVLVSSNRSAGRLDPAALLAFRHMWAEQLTTGAAQGAWPWLQFHNAPFEGDSQYYGAALAAVAVALAPADYRASPEIQKNLDSLCQYLRRERDKQILADRLVMLWASASLPILLTPSEQKTLAAEVLGKQQPDGGFSLSSFVGGWKRHDQTPLETQSDGYATGLVTFVLQQIGMPRSQPNMERGLAWLTTHQDRQEGRWLSYSLNKQRDLSSDVGRFMSDVATCYAVLSLESSSR